MEKTKQEQRRIELSNLQRVGWVLSEEERKELAALERETKKPAKEK